MATFTYRAIDAGANILTGRAQADSEAELEKKLGLQGLTLIETVKGRLIALPRGSVRFTADDLLHFSYFLHMIISSGVSILSGLHDLMANQEDKRIAHAAELVYNKVDSGMSLSEAMQEHRSLFPEFYVQLITAGEASGKLEKMLADLMRYLEWQIGFRKTVRAALIYPAVILTFVVLLMGVLFTFVFPRLINIIVGLKGELPLPTKVVLAVTGFVSTYYLLIIGAAAGGFFAFRWWYGTYLGRRTVDGLLLRIPLIGQLIRKIELSRYCKTLATLHGAGLNVERTFSISASVVRNAVLADALEQVTGSVINGEGIAPSLQRTGVFPSLMVEMVAIGERTGNLDTSVQRISDMFDKEVPETLKKVFSYFEPLVIALLGALVLGVLLSVFLPIYKIVGGLRVR